MGAEADIENAVCKYAEELGFQHRKLAWVGRRDAPDRIFWMKDIPPFFIEFKAPGEDPRRGQTSELASLKLSGAYATTIDDTETGKALLRHTLGSRTC